VYFEIEEADMPDQKQPRGKAVIPSTEDQRRYARELREQAESGDPFAKAALIMIGRFAGQLKQHGWPCGWVGDAPETKAAVLAAIRANNPDSGQLPENCQ